MTLLARAQALVDSLIGGLDLPRPRIFLGLPYHEPLTWALATRRGIHLSERCEDLTEPALRALLSHEVAHLLVAKHGGRIDDEPTAGEVARVMLNDPEAHAALLREVAVLAAERRSRDQRLDASRGLSA